MNKTVSEEVRTLNEKETEKVAGGAAGRRVGFQVMHCPYCRTKHTVEDRGIENVFVYGSDDCNYRDCHTYYCDRCGRVWYVDAKGMHFDNHKAEKKPGTNWDGGPEVIVHGADEED